MKQLIFLVISCLTMPAWGQADKPVAKEPAKAQAVKASGDRKSVV